MTIPSDLIKTMREMTSTTIPILHKSLKGTPEEKNKIIKEIWDKCIASDDKPLLVYVEQYRFNDNLKESLENLQVLYRDPYSKRTSKINDNNDKMVETFHEQMRIEFNTVRRAKKMAAREIQAILAEQQAKAAEERSSPLKENPPAASPVKERPVAVAPVEKKTVASSKVPDWALEPIAECHPAAPVPLPSRILAPFSEAEPEAQSSVYFSNIFSMGDVFNIESMGGASIVIQNGKAYVNGKLVFEGHEGGYFSVQNNQIVYNGRVVWSETGKVEAPKEETDEEMAQRLQAEEQINARVAAAQIRAAEQQAQAQVRQAEAQARAAAAQVRAAEQQAQAQVRQVEAQARAAAAQLRAAEQQAQAEARQAEAQARAAAAQARAAEAQARTARYYH